MESNCHINIFTQIFWVGKDAWLKIKMDYLVFDAKQNEIRLIQIPFWKTNPPCYVQILFFITQSIDNYPYEIGPYPSPLSWVSYMDSMFQLSYICSHCI